MSLSALRSRASTSRLPTLQLSRALTTGAITPPSIPKKDWPTKAETDFSGHPLWSFFHHQVSLEVPDKRTDNSSRSWTAFELRRKSFEDLHALWYICLKERNVLLSQREEARRMRLDLRGFTAQGDKLRMVQKSMARTKQVLSERRHAIIGAAKILRARGDAAAAEELMKQGAEFDNIDSATV